MQNYGWKLVDNKLTVIWDLDKNIENVKSGIRLWTMGCSCKTGCSLRCGCRKRKSACGHSCKCTSSCTNIASSNQNSSYSLNTQPGHSQTAKHCAGDNTIRLCDDDDSDDDFITVMKSFLM